MSAAEAELVEAWIPRAESHREWASLAVQAPQLTATMRRYLVQLTTFLAPRSVEVADSTLRQLARWLTANTDITHVAGIGRTHIEDYKVVEDSMGTPYDSKGTVVSLDLRLHHILQTDRFSGPILSKITI